MMDLRVLIMTLFIMHNIVFSQNNYAMSFDGIDDYVLIDPDLNLFDTDFSLSIWVKLENFDPKIFSSISASVTEISSSGDNTLSISLSRSSCRARKCFTTQWRSTIIST